MVDPILVLYEYPVVPLIPLERRFLHFITDKRTKQSYQIVDLTSKTYK